MSRTDKDKPWWVRATWMVPSHSNYCPHYEHGNRFHPKIACNLPAVPVLKPPAGYIRRWPPVPQCTWEPEYPHRDRYRYTRLPTKRDKHFDWWGPARARDRDAAVKARKQYLGSGDVDEPKVMPQHRHCSIKGWWD